jgi:hypothetical protein
MLGGIRSIVSGGFVELATVVGSPRGNGDRVFLQESSVSVFQLTYLPLAQIAREKNYG